jgi:2-dehydropantoate 2-reductase
MRAAGINAESSHDIRREIWIKLLRNVPLNSLCALTRMPIDGLASDPALMELLSQVIDEVVAIARAQGFDLPDDDVRAAREAPIKGGGLDGHGQRRGIKPSMLQDVLAGRAMEVESIVGMPQRFAREAGVKTPALDAIVPLLRGLQNASLNPNWAIRAK